MVVFYRLAMTWEELQPGCVLILISDHGQPQGSLAKVERIDRTGCGDGLATVRWLHLTPTRRRPNRNSSWIRERDLSHFRLASEEEIMKPQSRKAGTVEPAPVRVKQLALPFAEEPLFIHRAFWILE